MNTWQEYNLGEIATIEIGGTPSRGIPAYWANDGEDGLPWVSIADLQARIVTDTKERITVKGVMNSNVKKVSENTLIMSFKLSIGRAALAGIDLYTNEAIAAIVPKDNRVTSDLLYYILPPVAKNAVTDSAVKGLTLNKASLGKLPIKVPTDIHKQKKIAKILQITDQAIEKTEALIEKYQQIKAGLMHDLFTRGIGPDGKLRPPREQAQELYQETPIGWIPIEWSCQTVQELLAPVSNNLRSGPFGSALLKSELVEDGIPFLGIDNIHIEFFVDDFRRFVSEKKFLELNKYAVRPRDVVITIMGTVGRAAVIPAYATRALSSKHLWTMTFNQEIVIPELVCWQLNYAPWVKAWFRRETQGGIMDAIQSRTLRTLMLPLPPIDEQLRVFDRYSSLCQKLSTEEQTIKKLVKQKSGLMHDLLTGKVPVNTKEGENHGRDPEPEVAVSLDITD